MLSPLETAALSVQDLKQRVPLLGVVDRLSARSALIALALAELGEFWAERDLRGTSEYRDELVVDELNDIGVFVLSWIISHHGGDIDWLGITARANGYGRTAQDVERLAQVLGEIPADPRALTEFLVRYWSVAHHLPHFSPHSWLTSFELTIAKVMANYPLELFDIYCPIQHRVLTSQEEILQKYSHIKRCIRLIRNWVKEREGRSRLVKSDWQPYYWLIVNFYQAEANYQELQRLLTQEAVIVDWGARYARRNGVLQPV